MISQDTTFAIIYTVIAVIQLTLAVYLILINSRALPNRSIAALLILFTLNSMASSGILAALTINEARFWLWLRVATVYAIGPAIYLANIAVLRPNLLRYRLIIWPIVAITIIPTISVLLDLVNVGTALFGRPLIYQEITLDALANQTPLAAVTANSLLRRLFLINLVIFPVLSVIYPGLIVAWRDWNRNRQNSHMAFMLSIGAVISILFEMGRNSIPFPEELRGFISNLPYLITFVFAGLRTIDTTLDLRPLPEAMSNWPVRGKLVLTIVVAFVPILLISSVVANTILRASIIDGVGDNLRTLANVEAQVVSNEIAAQRTNVQNLALNSLIKTAINGHEILHYRRLDGEEEIRVEIEANEVRWQQGDIELIGGVTDPVLNSVLQSFRARFPQHVNMLVADQHGAVVTATTRPTHYDVKNEIWWQAVFNEGTPTTYVSPVQFNTGLKQYVIDIAVPISFLEGEFDGVLLSQYSLTAINEALLRDSTLGNNRVIKLFDFNGNYMLTAVDNTPLNWAQLTSNNNPWQILPVNGIDSIVSYQEITLQNDFNMPIELGVWAVVHQPTNKALTVLNLIEQSALLTFGVALILSVGLMTVLAGFITQPLSVLTRATERIRAGDLGTRSPLIGQDEFGALSNAFNAMAEDLHTLTTTLEAGVARRTLQLSVIVDAARTTSATLEVEELLISTVNLIHRRFEFYNVTIYLLDETGEYAVVQESTGEIGAVLKELAYRTRVGSNTLVGWVTDKHQARIARATEAETINFQNPMLPEALASMGIPLISGKRLYGALEIQSIDIDAFDEDYQVILQAIADQIAIALNNSLVFAETEAKLREATSLQRRYLEEAWTSFVQRGEAEIGFQFDGEHIMQLLTDNSPDNTLVETRSTGKLSMPLVVRGQTIGVLNLESSSDHTWNEDDRILAQSVIAQAGLALENARLLDNTQRLADRERLIGEITSNMRETLDIDTILQTTIREIAKKLELDDVEVHLGIVPPEELTADEQDSPSSELPNLPGQFDNGWN